MSLQNPINWHIFVCCIVPSSSRALACILCWQEQSGWFPTSHSGQLLTAPDRSKKLNARIKPSKFKGKFPKSKPAYELTNSHKLTYFCPLHRSFLFKSFSLHYCWQQQSGWFPTSYSGQLLTALDRSKNLNARINPSKLKGKIPKSKPAVCNSFNSYRFQLGPFTHFQLKIRPGKPVQSWPKVFNVSTATKTWWTVKRLKTSWTTSSKTRPYWLRPWLTHLTDLREWCPRMRDLSSLGTVSSTK